VPAATKDQRRQLARDRVHRLMRLRALGAPRWVIKSEQVGLALNRLGLRYAGLGRPAGKLQQDLEARHVGPLLTGKELKCPQN
jgi:hypothetical protein